MAGEAPLGRVDVDAMVVALFKRVPVREVLARVDGDTLAQVVFERIAPEHGAGKVELRGENRSLRWAGLIESQIPRSALRRFDPPTVIT